MDMLKWSCECHMTHHSLPVESNQHNDEQEDDHPQPNHPHIIGNIASKHSVVTLHEEGDTPCMTQHIIPFMLVQRSMCASSAGLLTGDIHQRDDLLE